ncbi:MAG: hypothetical protein FWC34_07735 [Bacteroidetes bacterium]|nr:hypothetical protein [Bacteroidota bacterium]MCL2302517.1 hypothetical protein [Lentimicrobiaceae bacterium]
MKTYKFSPLFFIIPLFVIGWGIFSLYFFAPFYAYSPDPEYAFLLNGLNVSLLEFNRIAYTDNPGITFQVYCGLIIRITHFFTGKDVIAQDVINRPEYYLSAISLSLIILHALLCILIAWIGKKREIKTWPLIILQSGVLLSITMLAVFHRINSERWLVIVSLLFIIVYLLYGYKDRRPLKFAIWSGIVMGMGMATKFNFLPIILLPFLLIDTNKNRLVYAATGVASFFFFLLPIINKLKYFLNFLIDITIHDGPYGEGEKRIFNPEKMLAGFSRIFNLTPALALLIFAIVVAIIIAIIYRKKYGTNRQILLFSGILFIILLQVIMVAKQFNYFYMLPLITMYPFILFIFHDFIQKIGEYKKWTLLPVILLFIVFTGSTTKQTYKWLQSEKVNRVERKIELQFVADNLPANALWLADISYRAAPYVENGLIWGTCYIYWTINYFSELTKKNPNIITYHYPEEVIRVWQEPIIPIDSIVVTKTPIHLYSSEERRTAIMMEMLEKAAHRNDVTLSIDTLHSNNNANSHIIVMQNRNSQKEWKTEEFIPLK